MFEQAFKNIGDVLWKEAGCTTELKVWFYLLDPGRNLRMTNRLDDASLAGFIALQKTFAGSPKSWSVDAKSAVVLETIRGLL
jgi:type I restriction enzyme M protein